VQVPPGKRSSWKATGAAKRVGPAVKHDEFATVLPKLAEVRAVRIQHRGELVVDRIDVVVEIEVRKVVGACVFLVSG
jgi:hypothetical protein